MKSILSGVKAALQTADELGYIDENSAYITPNEALFFIDRPFPQLAIADGPTQYIIEDGEEIEKRPSIKVIIYQELKDDDQSIMGNADPVVHGVLDIAGDVHSALFDNRLGVATIETALPEEDSETELLVSEDITLLKKTISYVYTKLEANP